MCPFLSVTGSPFCFRSIFASTILNFFFFFLSQKAIDKGKSLLLPPLNFNPV